MSMDNPDPAERAALDKHIAAGHKAFMDAYDKRDMVALKKLFTKDVRFMPPIAPLQIGTDGFEDFVKLIVSRGHHSIVLKSEEVFGPVGDMAGERLVVQFFTEEKKKKWDIKALHLYKKVDGEWRIFADCWNFDNQEPLA